MPTNNQFPPEAIKEFSTIFFKTFGKKLTQDEASKQAFYLFQLYDAVYGKGIKSVKKA
ncbi:MAG TPA: hypothetical protein VLF89_01150 [Candidatus Saccharimonadales bacterium]|nr:hypothetical protein [Candidatus Saccharimonadales bacterium]